MILKTDKSFPVLSMGCVNLFNKKIIYENKTHLLFIFFKSIWIISFKEMRLIEKICKAIFFEQQIVFQK